MELTKQLVELAKLFAVATKTLTKLITELVAELVSRTELKARVKIQQPKELKVLLITIHY